MPKGGKPYPPGHPKALDPGSVVRPGEMMIPTQRPKRNQYDPRAYDPKSAVRPGEMIPTSRPRRGR